MKRIVSTLIICTFTLLLAQAQVLKPAKWSYDISQKQVAIGETTELIFKVKIDKDWYLYSTDFDPNLGPMVTVFEFEPHSSYQTVGKIQPIGAKKKYDELWGGEYTYFTKTAEFRQKVKILSENPRIKVKYEYQVCTEEDGRCIPFDDEYVFEGFVITQKQTETKPEKQVVATPSTTVNDKNTVETNSSDTATLTETVKADTQKIAEKDTTKVAAANNNVTKKQDKAPEENTASSLFTFGLLAFLSGLVALFTPCVFPMIPMTVTFFTKQSGTRQEGIRKALVYGVSIILIYTIFGTIVAATMGPEFANFLSTHWFPNVLFFVIFIVFALSFLGMFEITLPSSWVNAMDKQSDKGGYYGVFFMAFTLALASFSCTGPVVGTVLVESASGQVLKPIVGMFGFSLAFALPFTLFAIFPSWLSNLPKSGGWLNSVKVVLGFLELALAFKFLSVADLAYHWNLLNRDVYLSIWIAVFSMMGLYLIGKLRLPHDSELKSVPVLRAVLATFVFAFVVYLIPGLWGAPLKELSGYLPPMSTQSFVANAGSSNAHTTTENTLCSTPKYASFLHIPHGLQGYFDYEEALACAKEKNKPVFIDFTGHGCVNCRKMEENVWVQPEVLSQLRNDFIIASLYVDDKTELPKNEWYISEYDKKEKKTLGKKNADLQVKKFGNNAQPYYLVVTPDGEVIGEPIAYEPDAQKFATHLRQAKRAFDANKKNQ
jgi:thiol:disulfide interchange protein DsbD